MAEQAEPNPAPAPEPAADTPPSSANPPHPGDWLGRLAQKRQAVGYVLVALALAFLIGAVACGMRAVRPADDEASSAEKAARPLETQSDYVLAAIWGATVGIVLIGGGAFHLVAEPTRGQERDTLRLLFMTLGAICGVLTAVLIGLGVGYVWRDAVFGGWTVWQGPEGWKIWVIIVALFGGLALAFVSIQLARADERSSPGLRRLLYGFNAVLTGVLLAAILLGINLLAYTPWGPFAALGKEYPWAAQNLYEVSTQSEEILRSLKKPAKIYVIMPTADPLYYPAVAFFDNCKNFVNDPERFDVEYLSPNRDSKRVDQLREDFKFDEGVTNDPNNLLSGVLIVYGAGVNRDHAWIKQADLRGDPERLRTPRFNGEQIVMTELSMLDEGKSRPAIYFTQGNGELDISPRPAAPDAKADILKRELEASRYKVKALQFTPTDKPADGDTVFSREVPADAGLLIIAAPREAFPKFALEALENYIEKRKGKLLIFFDVAVGPDKKTMVHTGLEDLLKKYNVLVGDDRVMRYDENLSLNPVQVKAQFPRGRGPSDTSFSAQEAKRFPFMIPMFDVRTVRAPDKPTGEPKFHSEILLEVPGTYVWAETDLSTDPRRLLTRLLDDKLELAKRLNQTKGPLPIAVTVSELPAGGPHGPMGDASPRMVVFGDATWISNAYWGDRGVRELFGAILADDLTWLRERPSILAIQNKHSDSFLLPPNVSFVRTVLLPGLFTLVTIVCLGAGVWVVRRR